MGFEGDNAVAVTGFELLESRIVRVHAQGVIERVEIGLDDLPDGFEVADHFVVVQFVGLEHEFHLAGVAVREPALVRVFGQFKLI